MQRPLSPYENFFRARSQYSFYNNFHISGRYSIELTKEITSKVLRKIILKNPNLCCNCFKENGTWIMKTVDTIRAENVFIDLISDNYNDLKDKKLPLVTEHAMKVFNNIKFELGREQLFKICINGPILSVIFDHSLFDGMVGLYFHREFDKYLPEIYSEISDPDFTDKFVIYEKGDVFEGILSSPIDDTLSWKIDYTKGQEYFDKILPYFDKSDNISLKKFRGRLKNTKDVSIAFKTIRFTKDELQRIAQACKIHGVTVTSYIQVIYVLSFRPVFGESYTLNKIVIALRRHMTTPEEIWSNSAHTGLGQLLPPLEEFSWDIVHLVNQNLKTAVNNKLILNTVSNWFNTFEKVEPSFKLDHPLERFYFESLLGKEKVETSKLSNLGVNQSYHSPEMPRLEDLMFSQDISPITSDFMINVISMDGMNIVVSYFEVEDDMEGLVEQFRLNLLKYAK